MAGEGVRPRAPRVRDHHLPVLHAPGAPALIELAHDAAGLARALPDHDTDAIERARREALRRPIAPVLGSGEADEVALHAGIKPLLRQVVPEHAALETRRRLEAAGLVVRDAVHRAPQASTLGRVLFVGRDVRRVEAAVACEQAPEHDLELGRLLGYPRCCVEAYVELPPPRDNLDALSRARDATAGRFRARLNVLDLAVFHYLSWIPCSFDCALSLAYADAVAAHIAERHGQLLGRSAPATRCPPGCRHEIFVREIDAALGAARVVLLEDVQISVRGTHAGGVLRVEEAWPTARDRHPEAVLEGDALEAVARATAAIWAARELSIEGNVLLADGRPLAATRHAAIHPFEAG